jgi:hypothetical protein
MLLQSVLGSRATTGVSAPYTHVLTPNDTLPFLTCFYAQPGGNFHKLIDAKLGSWELAFSPGSPLELKLGGFGKAISASTSKWSAATLVEGVDPFFTMIGANIKFDVDATPAVTRVRNVSGGTIGINRNLDGIQTDDVTYQYIAEQTREISIELTDTVFQDNSIINKIFYGSASGGNASGVVTYGSLDLTFIGSDGVAAATRSLEISIPRLLFTMDRVPDADPSGSTVRYTVTGRASKPTSGATITGTIINDQAATVYA